MKLMYSTALAVAMVGIRPMAFATEYDPLQPTGNSETILPVVVIETDNGPVRINETDYNPDVHTIYEPTKKEEKEGVFQTPEPIVPIEPPSVAVVTGGNIQNPAPAVVNENVTPEQINMTPDNSAGRPEYLVSKTGAKYFVVDTAGNPVKGIATIDERGYKTDGEAWAAVTATLAG